MTQQFITLSESLTLQFGDSVQLTGEVVYDQDNTMLYLVTDEDSEVLNINLDQYNLPTPSGHIWIKDWSEHTGLTAQLVAHGIVTREGQTTVGPFESPAMLVKIATDE